MRILLVVLLLVVVSGCKKAEETPVEAAPAAKVEITDETIGIPAKQSKAATEPRDEALIEADGGQGATIEAESDATEVGSEGETPTVQIQAEERDLEVTTTEGQSARVETDEGATEIDSGTELGEFPLPIMPGATPEGDVETIEMEDATVSYLTIQTSAPVHKAVEFYTKALEDAGFEVSTAEQKTEQGDTVILTGKGDGVEVAVAVEQMSDQEELSVILMCTIEK